MGYIQICQNAPFLTFKPNSVEWLLHLAKVSPPGRAKQNNLLDGEKPRMQKNLVPYGINNLSMFYKAVPILIFT